MDGIIYIFIYNNNNNNNNNNDGGDSGSGSGMTMAVLFNNQSRKLEPEVHDSCISDKDDNRSEWVRTRKADIRLSNRDKKIV